MKNAIFRKSHFSIITFLERDDTHTFRHTLVREMNHPVVQTVLWFSDGFQTFLTGRCDDRRRKVDGRLTDDQHWSAVSVRS